MAETNSLSFPNMINVSQNQVATIEDETSIVNRVRLLLLTEPTELYNNPKFGVGLKKYLFTYNNANTVAHLQDLIRSKVREFEPYVDADTIEFSEGLLYTGNPNEPQTADQHNKLEMTMRMNTTFGVTVTEEVSQFE